VNFVLGEEPLAPIELEAGWIQSHFGYAGEEIFLYELEIEAC
jgi:hypothetical protein